MKRFLVAAAAFAAVWGVAAHASAADLTETPVAANYDWSGLYIGANGGWGSSHSCWDGVFGSEGCHNATGGSGGAQLGYRWQSNNWVFGLEAQGDWADLKGSNDSTVFPIPFFNDRSRVKWYGLLTAQVGYSFSNALVYAKGGAAVTGNHFDVYTGSAFPPPATLAGDAGDHTRWGGALGAGLEYGITPNWSLAVEYDHLFMPDKTITFTTVPGGGLFGRDKISQGVDLVGLHLNYHWNG